jgi:hypothetical protein
MFASSVADYEAMSEIFPLSASIVIGGQTRDPADYWRHVMHLALLRKFFYGADQLNLTRVIDSMVDLIVDEQPNQRDHFAGLRDGVRDLAKRTHTIYNVDGEAPRGEAGVAIDDLYGRHLHGDYDRWVRTQSTPAVFTEMALTSWCGDAQHALRLVLQSLELGLEQGSMILH